MRHCVLYGAPIERGVAALCRGQTHAPADRGGRGRGRSYLPDRSPVMIVHISYGDHTPSRRAAMQGRGWTELRLLVVGQSMSSTPLCHHSVDVIDGCRPGSVTGHGERLHRLWWL